MKTAVEFYAEQMQLKEQFTLKKFKIKALGGLRKTHKINKMENVTEAKKWLGIAIRRHERHMKGTEPTTGTDGEISQKLMMEEMKYAQRSLVDGLAVTTLLYDKNITKFPDKPSSGGM